MSTKKISFIEIILWISVFLFILLALLPYGLGYKVKSDYSQLVDDFSQVLQLDIEIERYEQGFFSSDATLVINLPDMPIRLKEEIIHGPVYFGLLGQGKSPFVAAVVTGELEISEEQQSLVQKIFAAQKPLVYQNIIGFSGDVDSQGYMPPIDTQFEDEMGVISIQSSGMIIDEHYTASTRTIKGEATNPMFKMQSAVFSVDAENLSVSFSGAMGANEIMLGDSVMSIGLLNFDSGDDQIALKDIIVRSVTAESGDLINSDAQLSASEILASNQKFGPVKLNVSVNGLNAKSLAQLQELQKEVDNQIAQGLPEEQAGAMMMGQAMGVLPGLVRQAEIKINPLSVNSELGKLEADMDFRLDGITDDTPADPMFLLTAISLDLNLSIDELFLKQIISWQLATAQEDQLSGTGMDMLPPDVMEKQVSENIQGMVKENWLVKDEGVYFSKISMHQGEMLINDKSVDPMQQVMSSMGGAPQ